MNAQEAPHCPSGLSLAQPVDGVEAAVMRSAAVSVIPAIIHLHSEHGLYGVRGSVVTLKTQWALIWYWDHLKIFIAEIPQGPLGISIGTIWVIQKRFQGPPARGF